MSENPLLQRLKEAHEFYCTVGTPYEFEYDANGNKTTIFGEAAAEIDRLKRDKQKLIEILKEMPCEAMMTDVGNCLESNLCCCAIEDLV